MTLTDDRSDNLVEIGARIVSQINQGESTFVSVKVDGNVTMLVRALGPSLTTKVYPVRHWTLTLVSTMETVRKFATNDDWQSGANSASINLLEEAPSEAYESAETLATEMLTLFLETGK